jgi:hypothetical protein
MHRIIQHCGKEVQQEMLRFPKLHEKNCGCGDAIIAATFADHKLDG